MNYKHKNNTEKIGISTNTKILLYKKITTFLKYIKINFLIYHVRSYKTKFDILKWWITNIKIILKKMTGIEK